MPLRNPFKRSGNLETHVAPITNDRGFNDATVAAAKPNDEKELAEIQLSEIDDSGIFVPPSEANAKRGFWPTKTNSTTSSNHRSLVNENEPFSISRESFDSYRRSFDISARSPYINNDSGTPRRSLESSLYLSPRPSMSLRERRRADWPEEVDEDSEDSTFEDVKLAEDAKQSTRKRGFFARLSENHRDTNDSTESHPANASSTVNKAGNHHGLPLFGSRKRGQSGTGSELVSIPRPISSGVGNPTALAVGGE